MLLSMALLLLCGLMLYKIFSMIHLPGVLGLLVTGMLLGPYTLNMLNPSLLQVAPDLRQFALIIILIRAGLSLDVEDLKRVGRPALLLSFLPALLEIGGILLLGPLLLRISLAEALLLGTIVAAVSPAIVVPRMLQLMQEGYGRKRGVPQMVLAGATVDDIFVIVLFASALDGVMGGTFSSINLLQIPLGMAFGVFVGLVVGVFLYRWFSFVHMRDTVKLIVIISVATLLFGLEAFIGTLPYSGLIAIMVVGIAILKQDEPLAKRLSGKFEKLWVVAQVILFVLIGAEVQFSYALDAGLSLVLLICGGLVFRMVGVSLALIGSGLTPRERLFCHVAYMPKATVQAAIGAIPLTLGIPGGELFLTAAVVAILITAPLGAILMDRSYKKLLSLDR